VVIPTLAVACGSSIGGQLALTRHLAVVSALRASFEALAGSAMSPGDSADLIGKLGQLARIRA
jgi:hypothetical protein